MAKEVAGVTGLAAYGATDTGRRRRLNEDAYCVEPGLGLLAVADGLGGHPAGEVASSLAISLLRRHLRARLRHDDRADALDLMAEAVEAGNAAIRERMATNPLCRGMATTLTACLVKAGCAHFTHVGDSRAYLLREGRIAQLTEDHTAASLRRRQGRGGAPGRGNPSNRRLLSALGMSSWAGMDLFVQNLRIGDVLLLCTDGLTDEIDNGELAAACLLPLPLPERVARLLATANDRNGADNVTIVRAEF